MRTTQQIRSIGVVYNLKPDNAVGDAYEEYDEAATIDALQQEITRLGCRPLLFEYNDSFLKRIHGERPDFVLNIAEGIGISRNRESQVPCILESLNIPYSGSDSLSLGIALDKHLTWKILKSASVPVPEQYLVNCDGQTKDLENIFQKSSRWIVKPRWEGSSKGIYLTSVVDNYDLLQKEVNRIITQYHQSAIIEEFLEKEEITAGVIGNRPARILGMMKILPRDNNLRDFVYSLEVKRNWQEKVKYESQQSIAQDTQAQIMESALKVFYTLELRDIARIDFRLDRDNVPKVIDINPLPGLSPRYSDLPIIWKLNGNAYSDLIRAILAESFCRYGLSLG